MEHTDGRTHTQPEVSGQIYWLLGNSSSGCSDTSPGTEDPELQSASELCMEETGGPVATTIS